MATVTLAEMLVELRARGGYRRSTSLTDAVLTPFINSGIAEVHDLVCRHSPGSVVTSTDLATSPGSPTVNLPTRFYKSRLVQLVDGTSVTRLRRYELEEEGDLDGVTAWDAGCGAGELRYLVQAGTLRFVPTPTAAQTIRLWYLPTATELEEAGDTYAGTKGQLDLVYAHALRDCKVRDRQSTLEQDQSIAKLEKRLVFAFDGRDDSEPEYLADHGRAYP